MEGSSKSNKRKKIETLMKKNKKRHVINNIINSHLEGNTMDEKKSSGSIEKCGQGSFGVFEFPWMKESMISTSLDWSLPGSLFPVIDEGNEMFEDIGEVRWPVKTVSTDRLEFEAIECIWTSISD
ncbi:hypothetical protein EUTSA_v10022490mg [Eutrema salsugineum]|uniref:Uncharacterized protein n=1 Tax=Eutrema salsugineum TaxID=72664 RepID=V4L8Z5_EUTSA|nr:uncharacterized protein LOC18015331 [Eutrema salsugineum]ESQ38837.1 hypothetical protein EUTSA_v10022490mg [Eutrema salsugineum]